MTARVLDALSAANRSPRGALDQLATEYVRLWEQHPKPRGGELSKILSDLAPRLEALVDVEDSAFLGRLGTTKVTVVPMKGLARNLLNAIRREEERRRRNRASADVVRAQIRELHVAYRESARSRGVPEDEVDKIPAPTAAFVRTAYGLASPNGGRPSDAAVFVLIAEAYLIDTEHMAMIESLVHQGCFAHAMLSPTAIRHPSQLYGGGTEATRKAKRRWDQTMTRLGVDPTERRKYARYPQTSLPEDTRRHRVTKPKSP